jgi:V8-like Glu-specific endopeptidase
LVGQNIRHPNPNEYLYVVSILRVNSENTTQTEKMCIGTLVTRKDVLTAEHCLEGEELPYTAIYDWWFAQFEEDYDFDKNDIAVLRVNNQLKYIL